MNIQDFDFSMLLLIVLVALSIKSSVLAMLAWFGMKLTKAKSSTTRHQVAKFVLWSMLLMPALVFFIPSMPLPRLALNTNTEPAQSPSGPISRSEADVPSSAANESPVVKESSVRESSQPIEAVAQPAMDSPFEKNAWKTGAWTWAQLLAGTYLTIVFALLIRTVLGFLHCVRISHSAVPVQLPESQTSLHSVIESDRVSVPATIGIFNPKIVLPKDWATWDHSEVAMALAHESSHIERRDTQTKLLASINCALYWFHPLSWLLKKHLAELAEHICDDAVIEKVGARHEYAQCLVRMASKLSESPKNVSLGVGMARTALVEKRVTQILNSDRKLAKRRGHIASLLTLFLVAMVAALTSAVGGFSVPEDDDKPIPSDAIAGVVLMPDGSPAAEADVFLSTWVPPSHRTQTKADRKGRFVFTEFPDGVHRVIARSGSLSSAVRWGGEVTERGTADLEIQLGETSTLEVEVVDPKTSAPIPNAVVEISKWFPGWQQKTNETGVAVYAKLPREKWEVVVKAKGYAMKTQEVVVEQARTKVSISLSEPGADLFGRVTDETGAPVVKASVYFSSAEERADLRSFHVWARTDKEGNYRITGLPINKKLATRVVTPGIKDVETNFMLNVGRGEEQRYNMRAVRLQETTVEGTITDSDGNPIADARAFILHESKRFSCKTNELGDYKLCGRFEVGQLAIEAKGFIRERTQLDLAKRTHVFNAKLKPGNTCSGQVVDSDGKPLAGVSVQATIYPRFIGSYYNEDEGKTDSEGRFHLDSLPDDCRLRFSKKGYSTERNLIAARELKPVVLRPEGVVRGKVVDKATGKPIPSFRAWYTWSNIRFPDDPPKGSMGMASHQGDLYANANGVFEFDGFRQAVPIEVTVEAEGYKRCTVKRIVALESSKTETATFELEPVGELRTVSGRIVDSKDIGIAGVNVCLICSNHRAGLPKSDVHRRDRNQFPYNWEMILSRQIAEDNRVDQYLEATTDSEGSFVFANVQSSKDIEVVWWSDKVARERKPGIATLSAKEQRSLEIHAIQSGTVRGSIDTTANPYASPSIRVEGITYESKILDNGKTYQITGVPPGKYEVLIHGDRQPLKIPGREDDGAFTTSVIKRIPVEVKPGEISRADAAGDRM